MANLEAFGDEAVNDADSDFASEHNDTTVDDDVTTNDSREPESPKGWDGLDQEGAP